MKVHELIELLHKAPPEVEVCSYVMERGYEQVKSSMILLEGQEGQSEPRVVFDILSDLAFAGPLDGVPMETLDRIQTMKEREAKDE